MDVGYFSSNLEGYPGETDKEEKDESYEKNSRLGNVGEEDTNQREQSPRVREGKEEMEKEKEKEDLSKKDVDNVEEDTRVEKNESMCKDDMGKGMDDSAGRYSRLSFLHIAKLKVDSSLQADSQMYNELMNLKIKVTKME